MNNFWDTIERIWDSKLRASTSLLFNSSTPKIIFESNYSLDLCRFYSDFYSLNLLLALKSKKELYPLAPERAYLKLLQWGAPRIAGALFESSLMEIRHFFNSSGTCKIKPGYCIRKAASKNVKELLGFSRSQTLLSSHVDSRYLGTKRAGFFLKQKALGAKELLPILKLMNFCFYEFKWSTSYGGKSWGDITNSVAKYLSNELNAITFLDHAADLQHNGGSCFTKSSITVNNDFDEFQKFLDFKSEATKLEDFISNPCARTSKYVTHYLELALERFSDLR